MGSWPHVCFIIRIRLPTEDDCIENTNKNLVYRQKFSWNGNLKSWSTCSLPLTFSANSSCSTSLKSTRPSAFYEAALIVHLFCSVESSTHSYCTFQFKQLYTWINHLHFRDSNFNLPLQIYICFIINTFGWYKWLKHCEIEQISG